MIEVIDFTKKYGDYTAVDSVSCTVQSGMVSALLGLNGAGKTTLLKAICGYHFATSGEITVEGISVTEQALEVKRKIGYVSENPVFYMQFTVSEFLRFICDARKIEKNERRNRINCVLQDCALESVAAQKIKTLSKGFRQRLAVASALLHNPPVLILDEPTAALDPSQIIEMRLLLLKLAQTKTILLSTHIMQEVEALCSHVIVLHKGRIKISASIRDVIEKANMLREKNTKQIESMEEAFLFFTGEAYNREGVQ